MLANDSSAGGDELTAALVTDQLTRLRSPQHQRLLQLHTGRRLLGIDRFAYTATDARTSNVATVTITSAIADTPGNDAPVVGNPAFTVDTVNVDTGMVNGTVNVTDADAGDLLGYAVQHRAGSGAGHRGRGSADRDVDFTTAPARLAAFSGTGPTAAQFTVTASTGKPVRQW